MSPELYAELVRAGNAGIKRANPEALVAIGETSPHGDDRPSRNEIQDSHSPVRFARLLSEVRPRVPLDAWAQHPYPSRHRSNPADPSPWPHVSLSNLERFGSSLDDWFGGGEEGVPIWVTEYGHETTPAEPSGAHPEEQARYVTEALALAAGNPRIRVFVWFVLQDRDGDPWQSGLVDANGSPKPSLARFAAAAKGLDARNPIVTDEAEVARIPALELAYYTPAGSPVDVSVDGAQPVTVPLGEDGWLDVPLDSLTRTAIVGIAVRNETGQSLGRKLEVVPARIEAS